jgi:nucleotide-binding universal stress UspA family protein
MRNIVVGYDGSAAAGRALERVAEVAHDGTPVTPGLPADVILEVAREAGADLFVVGTGRKNVAERLVLGSVSAEVLQHAPCDVLVVP